MMFDSNLEFVLEERANWIVNCSFLFSILWQNWWSSEPLKHHFHNKTSSWLFFYCIQFWFTELNFAVLSRKLYEQNHSLWHLYSLMVTGAFISLQKNRLFPINPYSISSFFVTTSAPGFTAPIGLHSIRLPNILWYWWIGSQHLFIFPPNETNTVYILFKNWQ